MKSTKNITNIEEIIRDYESHKLLLPNLTDLEIFERLSADYLVITLHDVDMSDKNGYCVNCKQEPCMCHLKSTI